MLRNTLFALDNNFLVEYNRRCVGLSPSARRVPLADGGAGWAIAPLKESIWLLGVMAGGSNDHCPL